MEQLTCPEPGCERFGWSLGVVAALAMLLGACSGGKPDVPSTLMDGTPVPAPPVRLQGVADAAVFTVAEVVGARGARGRSPSRACLRASAPSERPKWPFVERVGVESASVSFATASGLHACDDSAGPRENDRRWCGTAYGSLAAGHLRDPRLDIAGCTTAAGARMAFAWVEPGSGSRYLGVAQDGYVEVYEPAGGLPIRVATTSGVEPDGARATFRLSEYGADGEQLRSYELETAPAG